MKNAVKVGRKGGRFGLCLAIGILLILSVIAYTTGIYAFSYYSDFELMIPVLSVLAALVCVGNEIFMEKGGSRQTGSILTVAVSLMMVVALVEIVSARVYSIAILLFSDLDRGNTDGYHALYFSLASIALLTIGLIGNFVAGFMKAKISE